MVNSFLRAKEIFIKYCGCRENMQDDNCLDEYLKYNITRETEYSWKDEFIKEQFSKADSKSIRVLELIGSVSFMVSNCGEYSDYKKLLSIKDTYLQGEDMFIYIMYFEKVIDSIRTLTSKDIPNKLKLEIINHLEDMFIQTINRKDEIPNETYKKITQKYNIPVKDNYTETKLQDFYNQIEGLKRLINYA